MAKITTASYIIVAVCIFQIADAGLLPNPLSLLNNAQEQLTNRLQNVKTLGQNHGTDLLKLGQKTEIGLSQKILQSVNTPECIKVHDEGQEIIGQLTSILTSCITNETQSVSKDIEKLTNMINDLYPNLEKTYQNALQCSNNPIKMIPYLITVWEDVSEKLVPMFQEVVSSTGLDLVQNVLNVKTCFKMAYLQSSQQNVRELVKDAGQCFESVLQKFI